MKFLAKKHGENTKNKPMKMKILFSIFIKRISLF